MTNTFYKLILVTQRENSPLPEYLDFVKQCISSGVTSVQLREKNADSAFKLYFAQQLKQLLAPYNIPLLINDDIELALQIDAEGIHLGQSDGSPQLARERLGNDKFIGLSIESEEQLKQANNLNVDYVAASAVFPTLNKNNLKTIWGLKGLSQLSEQSVHPIVGIGGITEFNLRQLMQAGAHGAAVIGALHQAENPVEMALKLRTIIDMEYHRDRNY